MKLPGSTTIFAKILIVALTPILLLALILSSYVVNARLGDLDEAFEERGKASAREMASAALLGLFTGDRQVLIRASQQHLAQDIDVVEVLVLDQLGATVARARRGEVSEAVDQLIAFSALVQPPALAFGSPEEQMTPNPIGRVVVRFSQTGATARASAIVRNAILITLAAVLGTLLIAAIVGRQIARPLVRLREAVRKITQGDFDIRLPETAAGEIGDLESGVNKMADAIAISADEMQREVAQATSDLQQTMDALEVRNIELDLARKRAMQASAAKSEFLANMSHEIRTPMNGVLGFAGLLRKSGLDAIQQGYVKTIIESANSLLSSINEILDFSKMEAGKLSLEVNVFRLRGVVESVVQLFHGQAKEKGLVLISSVEPDVPDALLGDALRLRQILNNFFSNAVKFTASGEVTLCVARAREQQDTVWLTFTVSDTGIGIPADAIDQLFDPFSQGALSTMRVFGGTGLGLNIAQRLSQAMGGSIEVTSEENVGSKFTIRLPFQPAETSGHPASVANEVRQPRSMATHDWLAGRMFLVADDNPINLHLVETLLDSYGGSIVRATDGQTAREMALTTAIDMAFLDIHMPELNGIELARQIHAAKPDLPMVALTADSTMKQDLATGDRAFFAVLIKPFDEESFNHVIAEALDIKTVLVDELQDAGAVDGDTAAGTPPGMGQMRDRSRAIRQAAGSESIADSLFRDFLAALPMAMDEIDAAYAAREWQALWQATHKLQGAAAICSLPALHAALVELARAARNPDSPGLANAVAGVRHEVDRLIKA